MAMTHDTLECLIVQAFPGADVTLTALVDDNDHWQAEIVSELFRGKTRIAQHQMVYNALSGKMGSTLHALSLKTRAPD